MSDHSTQRYFTPHQEFTAFVKFEEDKLCENEEEYGAWLSNASTERTPAPGMNCLKSTQELVWLTIGRDSTMLQRAQASEELRRRYLDEFSAQIIEAANNQKRNQERDDQRKRYSDSPI